MRGALRWTSTGLLAAALALSAAAVHGAEETQHAGTAPQTTADEVAADAEAVGFETPQASVRGFLEAAARDDWTTAASHLDLRATPGESGEQLARQLSTVLDRTLLVDVDGLSTEATGAVDDGQPRGRDLVGRIETANGPVRIYVERVPGPDGDLEWKIARATMKQVPALYQELGDGPLAEYLPPVLLDVRVLRLQLWQWIGLAMLLVATLVLAWLATTVALGILRRIVRRTASTLDDRLLRTVKGPLELLIGVGVFTAGMQALRLPVFTLAVLGETAQALVVLAVTWIATRLVGATFDILNEHWLAQGQVAAVSMVPLARRVSNVFVLAVGVLVALQSFGLDLTAVIAGLGIGGLAVALAAQPTLANLFGGISLITDRPVRVGDFCRFGDRLGTIEEIGLRSTRVRTLDRTVVTVPNSEFSTLQLENFAHRDRIWLSTTLGLRYETTPDQLRWVLVKVKELLLAHPKIDPSPARVRFAGFGAYSLDVEIFAYVLTPDFNEFCAIREDVFLRIMDVVAESGTGFAFPSQTIYTGKDDGLDEARSRQAADEVRRWREANALPLPDVPPERERELAGTLDYPPKGSPSAR
jgi:MscS family membrane protein